jgi:hypothetical protein
MDALNHHTKMFCRAIVLISKLNQQSLTADYSLLSVEEFEMFIIPKPSHDLLGPTFYRFGTYRSDFS